MSAGRVAGARSARPPPHWGRGAARLAVCDSVDTVRCPQLVDGDGARGTAQHYEAQRFHSCTHISTHCDNEPGCRWSLTIAVRDRAPRKPDTDFPCIGIEVELRAGTESEIETRPGTKPNVGPGKKQERDQNQNQENTGTRIPTQLTFTQAIPQADS
ncbi:hypothetical protein EVAR_36780_1 [Eumeta japonica]|uniref:Uncharacterized protein n=1 Tax=Eumeta variegata TaxID=151549 RepID=A0A4C1X2B9_EUMVA|nr:hypothetical protein EVAR_36780_1 [Eumeta japonica]